MKNKILLFLAVILSFYAFGQSLWNGSSGKSAFAPNNKTYKTGDIITIEVLESPSLSVSDNVADYNSAARNTVGSVFKTIGGVDLKSFVPLTTTDPSAVKLGNKQTQSSSQASIKLYIAAQIIEENNGLLKIKGEKEIKVGKERKKVIVEGLLAASSISSSGTVESSQLAEARIWYDGDVVFQQDPNEKSWLSWVLSGISNIFF